MDQLKQIVSKLFKKNRTAHVRISGESRNIRRDWLILLVSGFLVLIVLVLFSAYLFVRVSEGSLFVLPETEGNGIETIDRGLLSETLERFEQKAINFESLKVNPPDIGNL